MKTFCAAFLAALFLSGSAWAQDVTLTSRDGGVRIDGNLLSYDGDFFRVETRFGVLSIDSSGVQCDGPGCPDMEHFVARATIAGARTMSEVLLPALIEAFAERNRFHFERIEGEALVYRLSERKTGQLAGEITLMSQSSGAGIAALLDQSADIAASLRAIRPDEVARANALGLRNLGSTKRARVLALDALVPLVSPSNPLRAIGVEDLARVFAGQVTNWNQIGGQDAPVVLHLRDEGSGLASGFVERVMTPQGLALADVQVHSTNDALAAAVVADPYAIGIGSRSEPGRAKTLSLTGDCGFESTATVQALKTEDYPLSAPLFLYTARRMPALVREFLDYVQSSSAQMVIRRAGFVDQQLTEIPMRQQGDRLANAIRAAGPEIGLPELQEMLSELDGARRLSLSFRFKGGAATLDPQSGSNVALLAAALESGAYDGRTVIFAGFSDGAGGAAVNRRLSEKRAQSVRDAVMRAAPTLGTSVDIRVAAFGEAMPMACDDTDWGSDLNRRVEVWLR